MPPSAPCSVRGADHKRVSNGCVPHSLVRFEAAGGTGQWQFAFEENRSGAVLNPTTGTYLAGDRLGVIDAIILTDANCEGSARLEIQIVNRWRPILRNQNWNPVM